MHNTTSTMPVTSTIRCGHVRRPAGAPSSAPWSPGSPPVGGGKAGTGTRERARRGQPAPLVEHHPAAVGRRPGAAGIAGAGHPVGGRLAVAAVGARGPGRLCGPAGRRRPAPARGGTTGPRARLDRPRGGPPDRATDHPQDRGGRPPAHRGRRGPRPGTGAAGHRVRRAAGTTTRTGSGGEDRGGGRGSWLPGRPGRGAVRRPAAAAGEGRRRNAAGGRGGALGRLPRSRGHGGATLIGAAAARDVGLPAGPRPGGPLRWGATGGRALGSAPWP